MPQVPDRTDTPRRRRAMTAGGLAAAGATVLFAPSADAATFQVTDKADSGPGTLRQAVADANTAPGADTITFRADVTGDIDLTGGGLTVTDALTLTGPGAAVLAIDGNNAGTVLSASADLTLNDLTVKGGSPSAIVTDNAGAAIALVVDGVTVSGSAALVGGGIRSAGETVTVRDSTVSGNVASTAGGGIANVGGSLLVEDSTLSGNTAQGANGGGGIYNLGGGLTVRDSTLSGNAVSSLVGRGGAISLLSTTQATRIERSEIENNTASGKGAALANKTSAAGGTLDLIDSVVSGNTATGRGGAMFLYRTSGPMTFDNSEINDNTTNNRGGGIFLYNASGDVTFTDTQLSGNRAPTAAGNGGALFFYRSSAGVDVAFVDSEISGNSVNRNGGGLFFYKGSGKLSLTNTTVANNSSGTSGGALFTRGPFGGTASLEVTGSTVAGNTSASGVGGLDVTSGVPSTVQNSIVADNTGTTAPDLGTGGSNTSADFSLIESTTGATFTNPTPGSNITGQDPQLSALGANSGPTRTKRPAGTSPAIDAGKAFGLLTDQRGRPRPFDIPSVAEEPGSDGSDIGAFEIQGGSLLLTSISPVGPAADTTPVLKGTAPEDAVLIELHDRFDCAGTVLGSGTPGQFESTGITATVPAETTTIIYARAVDGAGETMGCTPGITYVEDSAPPSLSVDGFVSGTPANGNTPRLRGTAEAPSTVRIYTNAACTGSPVASGSSTAFEASGIALPAVADNTSTSYWVNAIDPIGNVAACAGPFTYVEDSAAPGTPTIASVSPVSPANDNTPRLQGAAAAGSTVRIYKTSDCSGTPFASGTAAEFNGAGIQLPTVADNSTTTFYATATDAAGNVSGCSGGLTYVEDSSPPPAPTVGGFVPGSPANDNTPLLQGTSATGSTVRVYTDASCTGTPVATGTAAELASPGIALPAVADDTTTAYYLTATDQAGNVSACAGPARYTEDSSAPSAPALDGFAPSSDNTPLLTGRAAPGTTVRVYTDAACTGAPVASGTADDLGDAGIALSVPADSTTTFYATATDAAGNVSACSDGVTYVEDSTPPAAPALSGFQPGSPAGDNTPRLRGSAPAGTTVRVYTDASCTGTPVATGTAADLAGAGIALAVADDTSTAFYATATDAAGNVSACSDAVTYVEDSTAPAAPDLTAFPAGPANGNAPRLLGTADPGTTIRVYTDASCTGTPVATGTAADLAGAGIALAVADDTSTAFYAVAVDGAGNVSDCAGPVTYLEDSGVDAPSVALPGSPANENAPRLTGTAEAGSTISVYTTPDCSGTPVATGSAADLAGAGIALPAVADDTTTVYRVRATDEAGNVSDCAGPFTYIEDSSAATPSFTGLGAGSTADLPRFVGAAEPGATVRIYATPDCSGTPLASGTADEFAGPGIAVPVSTPTAELYASQVDPVGNTSVCSVPISYTKAPAVTGPASPAPAVVIAPPAALAPGPLPGTTLDGRRCVRIPRLTRHTLKGAVFILRKDGCSALRLQIKGTAKRHPARVVKQWPKPGSAPRASLRLVLRIR